MLLKSQILGPMVLDLQFMENKEQRKCWMKFEQVWGLLTVLQNQTSTSQQEELEEVDMEENVGRKVSDLLLM